MNGSRRWTTASLASLALAMAGCGADAPAADDFADVIVRAAEPVARIGSLNDPEQSLTEVGPVTIGPAGRLFIGQPQDATIRVHDATGALVRTIGRSGEGPGEFGRVWSLGFRGDTLWVGDVRLRRVSYFTAAGGFLDSRQWASGSGERDETWYMSGVPQVILDDGTALLRPRYGYRGSNPEGPWTLNSVVPILRIDSTSEVLDTLAWWQWSRSGTTIQREGTPYLLWAPIENRPHFHLMPDGSGMVIAEAAEPTDAPSSSFRLTRRTADGDTAFSQMLRYAPKPVPESLLREEIARAEEQLTGMHGQAPGQDAILDALRDAGLIPPWLPPVTDLVGGQDGSIWLRREEAVDSVAWHIFDRDGELRGEVRLPAGQRVVAARGSLFVTSETDALDVPFVTLYRMPAEHRP